MTGDIIPVFSVKEQVNPMLLSK